MTAVAQQHVQLYTMFKCLILLERGCSHSSSTRASDERPSQNDRPMIFIWKYMEDSSSLCCSTFHDHVLPNTT